MTNKEYIEKNNISFSDAMKMYDNEKYPSINDWLKEDRIKCPFKVGDFLKNIYHNDAICVVIDIKDFVYYRMINRFGTYVKRLFDDSREYKYYAKDNTVYAYPIEECSDNFEKIY